MKQTLNLEWAPATGKTAGTALGWSMIASGTVSHPALTSTNLLTQMRRTRFASASTANASAGLISSDALCWRGNAAGQGGFVFAARFSMSANVASSRAFVGLSSSPSSLMSAEPSASVDTFGVGFDSTDPSGGNWILIRNDASTHVKEALGATTIAGASDGLRLPQAIINVASTAGFPSAGTISVTTSAGVQTVHYAGVTATSFTGCTGGTGTMSRDGAVALGSTAIAAGSDGQSLHQSTINVASTAGFASSGIIYVATSSGNQVVTYTGMTGTSFTGCAGGTGTMSTGGTVTASAAWRNSADVYDLTISAEPNGTQIVVSLMNLSTGTVVLNNVAYSSNLPTNTAFLYAHAETGTGTGPGPGGGGAAVRSTHLELAGMSLVEKRGTSLGTLEPLGGWYDVTDYGATGDGRRDDTAAINAAIQAAKNLVTWNGDRTAGGRVYLPPGRYRCAGQILIDGSVSLQGAKGEGTFPAVTLLFDENLTVPQNGLLRVRMGTSRTGATTGGFLTISDIAVVQVPAPGSTAVRDKLMTVAGILINAPFVQLHNVMVSQIQGHGIEITSSVTDVESNADCWLLSGNIRLSSNVGHGLYTHGGDSSAGASVGLIDARSNGGYGVYEDSFLGNSYAAIHTTSNGIWHGDAVRTNDHTDKWVCDASAFIYGDCVPNGDIPSNSKPIWQQNSVIALGELCIPTWSKNTWFLYRATYVDPANNKTHPTLEPIWPTPIGATVTDGGIRWTCWRELGGAVSNGAQSAGPGTLSNNKTEYGSIYTEGDQNQVYLAAPARVPESSPYLLDARSAPPKRATATNMPIEIQNPYPVGNHLDPNKSRTFVGLGRWGYGVRTPVGIDPDVIFRWGANSKYPWAPNDDPGVWLGDFKEHEFRYRGEVADGIYRYEQRFRTDSPKSYQTWHSYQINGTRGAQLQPAAFVVPSLWIGNQMGPTHETRIGAVHSVPRKGKPNFANANLAGCGYFPSGSILFNKDYPTNGPIGWIAKEDCGVRMAGPRGQFGSAGLIWAGNVCQVTDGGVWVALNRGHDPNSANAFNALTSTPGATYNTGTINWKCVGTSSGNPNSWEDFGPTTSATSWSHVGNARRKEYEDIANIQTSDATVTSLFTWTIPDDAVSTITAEVEAIKIDGSATASYVRRVRLRQDAGAVTVGTVDTTWTDEEAAFAGCDVTIDNSGSTGRVRVTGIAATPIDWSCKVKRSETTHTTVSGP